MSKGAYKYEGGKCMSGSKAGLTGSGKMSAAHGTNGQSTKNNMNRNPSGAVGSGCRTFSKGIPGEAHVRTPIAGHAKQPSGHKKDA